MKTRELRLPSAARIEQLRKNVDQDAIKRIARENIRRAFGIQTKKETK